jgi:hypothetical protein
MLMVAGSTVRAEAQNSYQDRQIADIQQHGVSSSNERLARIEATQDAMKEQLGRIEHKLDEDTRK